MIFSVGFIQVDKNDGVYFGLVVRFLFPHFKFVLSGKRKRALLESNLSGIA